MILLFFVFRCKGTNNSPNSKKNSIFAIKKDDQNATGLHHIIRRNAMSEGGIRWMYFDAFSSKSSDRNILINTYEQGCSIAFWCRSFTGKERDEETGYGYFGARYMDHELMTMWLSVDPLADKYPGISPYAYCAWNPVKLVDPDGRDTIRIELTTGEIDIGLSKNEHRVELMKNNEIVWDLNCTNTINVSSYSANTETGHSYFTDRIEFGKKEEGQAVFDKISSYASSQDTRCPVEWDYYGMENGSGHLLTSHRNDCVMSYQDAYTDASVCSYDHYHPLQKWSTIPSESDFNHRDRLNSNGKYVPCRLHTGGKYYLFNTLNRKCPSNKSFENKIEFINPEMKSVML